MSDQKFDKRGTFTLGINKYKTAGDKKPEMTGIYTTPEGVEMQCSAWRRKNDKGEVWYSGKIQPKQDKGAARPAPAQTEESDW